MISVAIRADAPLERFVKTASAPQNYEKIIPPRSVIFHDNNVFRAILVVTWIGFAALLPLRCTLDLCTCVRGFKVYATIVIAEEQAESSGAYVGGRTVYLYGIIAVAVAFDPRCGRPFANAPCWVVLRATMWGLHKYITIFVTSRMAVHARRLGLVKMPRTERCVLYRRNTSPLFHTTQALSSLVCCARDWPGLWTWRRMCPCCQSWRKRDEFGRGCT